MYSTDVKTKYSVESLIQSGGGTEDLRSHGNPGDGRCLPERARGRMASRTIRGFEYQVRFL